MCVLKLLILVLAGVQMTDRNNGMMLDKRKRRNMYSSDEEQDGSYDEYFSEERYRAMLGEHVHKYKRRHKNNNLPSSGSTRNGMLGHKGSIGSKDHKLGNGRAGAHKIEMVPHNVGHYKDANFSPEYGLDRFVI